MSAIGSAGNRPVLMCHKSGLIFLLFICSLYSFTALGQVKDTSDKVRISIDNARTFIHIETDSGKFTKFIGDVILRQGSDTLYCDSAYENESTKNFDAYSNVKIAQAGGTKGTSDYLKYTSQTKMALMRGNVALTDGKNNLVCEEATYDLANKVAVYDNWGTLHNDSTTVTSRTGVYYVKEKNARFKGNVYITDPQYKLKSEDLLYNTETKVTQFFAMSEVIWGNGTGLLKTSRGTYDGMHGIADFKGRSAIWNDGQYIEGDSLKYSKLTGHGIAIGNVISIDTEHHSTMKCGFVEYFQKQRRTMATINPVLIQANGKDTLYMAADTFFSAPMVKSKFKNPNSLMPGDTLVNPEWKANTGLMKDSPGSKVRQAGRALPKKDTLNWVTKASPDEEKAGKAGKTGKQVKKGKNKKDKTIKTAEPAVAVDTAVADTTAPLYFIGYHHVLIFSDSLQGKCDSICYTRSDSMIRMMFNPIAWAHNSQITGDTIMMQLDSTQMRRLYVPNNAFMVSRTGPEKAKLFNQVQGKTLTAYFANKQVTKIVVTPNAECIYYPTDEKDEYLGLNNSTSVLMRILFVDQKITNIKLEKDPKTTMQPLEKADLDGAKLSRFKWLIDQRPKNKEELFK
jgi:lipopolysaccharide export system protein LptA